jgi:hypothetical protein
MYSRQETALLKQQFWTVFGQYMSPVLSAGGEHINWMNYKTGEKDIYFRMHADNTAAYIAIVLTHKDEGLRALYMEQFEQLKPMLQSELGEEWTWQNNIADDMGKITSRIYHSKQEVNVLNKADWPELISFFKPRIIALDAFWSNAKYAFELLR